MVGLCGIIGPQDQSIENIVDYLFYQGDEENSTYNHKRVSIGYVDHSLDFSNQPATVAKNNIKIWVWGDVIGHEINGEYRKRPDGQSQADYCAGLYDEYGEKFVEGLNSEFAGVIYDLQTETVSIFTDRLGSRPVYYTHTNDDSIVFSTLLQSLDTHQEVDLEVDPSTVPEYLQSRTFGTVTPVKDVKKIPPASIITFNNSGDMISEECYWQPNPTPLAKDLSYFIREFSNIFTKAVKERRTSGSEAGLLLSGGTDSRAVLSVLDNPVSAFHYNIGSPLETEIASRSAEIAGAKFELINRDPDFWHRVHTKGSKINNMSSHFFSYWALGFPKIKPEITEDTDELFCGEFSDTILQSLYVPLEQASGPLKYLIPPSQPKSITSSEGYINAIKRGDLGSNYGFPAYVSETPDPEEVLKTNISQEQDSIRSHNIDYPSWQSLMECGRYYPLTNARSMALYESLIQLSPTRYPYLDNRLIDLALQLPPKYHYRRDIVSQSLPALDEQLSNLSHPDRIFPIHYPKYLEYPINKILFNKPINIIDKIWRGRTLDSQQDNNSKVTLDDYLGSDGFDHRMENNYRSEISAAGWIDEDEFYDMYENHLSGQDNIHQLSGVLTLLESNIRL